MGCVLYYLPLSIRQCKEPDLNKKLCFLMGANVFLASIRNMIDLCSDSKQGILKPCIYSLEESIFQTLYCKSASGSEKARVQHSVVFQHGLIEPDNLN